MQYMVIPGKPVSKGRHQVRLYGGLEKAVRAYALNQRIKKQEGDLAVIVTFCGSIQGDVDNLLKSLLNSLNGVAWEDDKQVKTVLAVKKKLPSGSRKNWDNCHEHGAI